MSDKILILITEMSTRYEDEFTQIWKIGTSDDESKPEVGFIAYNEISNEIKENTKLILIRGYGYDLERTIVPNLNNILKSIETQTKEVIIGIHGGGGTSRAEDLKSELKNITSVYNYSMHPIPEEFKDLIEYVHKLQGNKQVDLDENQFNKYLEIAINGLKKNKDLIQPFSLLKHRIAHLFLPMDIDLQGISEVKSKNNIEKAVEYLKEVVEEKKDNPAYYRQRLADLWYILVKGKMENGKWKMEKERKIENGKLKIDYFELIPKDTELKTGCVPVPPRQDCESLLAEGKGVIDLLAEDGKLKVENGGKQQEIINWWNKLLTLCGLQYDNGNPFDKTKIYPQSSVFNSQSSKSEILQFMCVLDCKIQKYSQNENSISNSDIDEILESKMLNEILGSNFSHLKSDIYFHWWFCALDKCLDKLREVIKDKDARS
ncbi:MAG: hypothetical protein ABIL40_10825 [candidate division WOR-3 bacterium]